jgi:hypothetical protein
VSLIITTKDGIKPKIITSRFVFHILKPSCQYEMESAGINQENERLARQTFPFIKFDVGKLTL